MHSPAPTTTPDAAYLRLFVNPAIARFQIERASAPAADLVDVKALPAEILAACLTAVSAHVSALLLDAFRSSPAEGARQAALIATNYQELMRELVGEAASWACATAATASDARDKGER